MKNITMELFSDIEMAYIPPNNTISNQNSWSYIVLSDSSSKDNLNFNFKSFSFSKFKSHNIFDTCINKTSAVYLNRKLLNFPSVK